jgi:predicted glutamine amidotransferase
LPASSDLEEKAMCRLLLSNKSGIDLIEKKYGLEKFMKYLEEACGGQGNGITLVKHEDGKKKIVMFKKGVKYSVKNIIHDIKNKDYDWLLFHTRVKSVGEVSDANCHPFRAKGIYLAMNGTESKFSGLANMIGTTDTEAVLKSVIAFDLPLLKTLSNLNAAYIGFYGGVPFAVANSKFSCTLRVAKEDDALVFASQFPKEIECFEPVKVPFVWTPNREMPELKKYESPKESYWSDAVDGIKKRYNFDIGSGWRNVEEKEEDTILTVRDGIAVRIPLSKIDMLD